MVSWSMSSCVREPLYRLARAGNAIAGDGLVLDNEPAMKGHRAGSGERRPMMSDLEIAQRARMKPIAEIADGLGIDGGRARAVRQVQGQGRAVASSKRLAGPAERQVHRRDGHHARRRSARARRSRPIGLSQALEPHRQAGRSRASASRRSARSSASRAARPAAATAQVVPMEDFNLHLTGDIHAVALAHNLLAAFDRQPPPRTATRCDIDPLLDHLARASSTSATARCATSSSASAGSDERPCRARPASTSPWPREVMAILALTTSLQDLRAAPRPHRRRPDARRQAGHRRGPQASPAR